MAVRSFFLLFYSLFLLLSSVVWFLPVTWLNWRKTHKTHTKIGKLGNVEVGLLAVIVSSHNLFGKSTVGSQAVSKNLTHTNTRSNAKINANPFWRGVIFVSLRFVLQIERLGWIISNDGITHHGKMQSNKKSGVCVRICVTLWRTAPFIWIATWLALKT